MQLKFLANLALLPAVVALAACTLKLTTDEDDAGVSGAGGSGGTGSPTVTGGSAGAAATGGAAGTAGTEGAVGAGGSSVDAVCDTGAEAVPNDDREHAIKATVGTLVRGCLQSDTDVDFYEFTAPAAPAQGGFFQVQVTDVGTKGDTTLKVYAANDNGDIDRAVGGAGESVFAWFAAQPGVTFRASVSKYIGVSAPNPHVFTAKFTGVPDQNEPNHDLDHATQITTNTDASGYFFAGLIDSTDPKAGSGDDYFKVALTTAPVTVTLKPPADARAQVVLRNEQGTVVGSKGEFTPGSSAVVVYTPPAAGTYYVLASTYLGGVYHGTGSTVPAYYTLPYKLTVAQ